MLVDPRNGPAHDLPPHPGPLRPWIVASVPRCGSTWLCRMVWDTGVAGAPKEYLNPMQVRDWQVRFGADAPTRLRHRLLVGPAVGLAGRLPWSDARLRAHLDAVRARRTGPSGHVGLKIHWHHFRRWFLDAGREPDAFLGHAQWVRLVRRDRVAQAVSWSRALQTGRWASTQQSLRPPVYDRASIERCLHRIDAADRGWARWLAGRRVRVLELAYEDVVADPDRAVRTLLTHLGAPEPDVVSGGGLRRQADATSEAWAARFRAERSR